MESARFDVATDFSLLSPQYRSAFFHCLPVDLDVKRSRVSFPKYVFSCPAFKVAFIIQDKVVMDILFFAVACCPRGSLNEPCFLDFNIQFFFHFPHQSMLICFSRFNVSSRQACYSWIDKLISFSFFCQKPALIQNDTYNDVNGFQISYPLKFIHFCCHCLSLGKI